MPGLCWFLLVVVGLYEQLLTVDWVCPCSFWRRLKCARFYSVFFSLLFFLIMMAGPKHIVNSPVTRMMVITSFIIGRSLEYNFA